ncbi:ribokinase [Deinococcus sp. VB343]|uniref:Ribokinase n=1 Tax=Deinococcus sp. VB142 TaxID=3112952 RepID=A0AAU6Q738_9DEIO
MPASILVVGSANVDFVTRLPHLPAPGETVLGESYTTAPGGKGANQAVACARAGGQVAFCGALGRDPFADLLFDSLRQSGVEDWTLRADLPTGAAFISVSDTGENCIAVASGANGALRPAQLPTLGGVRWLVLQLELPLDTVLAAAQAAHRAGGRVVLNAAPARDLPAELWPQLDVLVVNEGELTALVGPGKLDEQLRRAQARGPQTVIVTLGGRGCRARQGEETWNLPALSVPVRDTTGAGDTFVGVLVARLDAGEPLPSALAWAVAASALACTREGAQPSMPTRAEIEAALVGE